MSDMLERAARAFCIACDMDPDELESASPLTDCMVPRWKTDCPPLRAALLAALDPEDEALIEHVARAMCVELGLHADDWSEDAAGERIHVWQKEAGTAREAIAAMRSYTSQGEL